jgi:hypothetical protein
MKLAWMSLACALLAGCEQDVVWDKAMVCSGLEVSSSPDSAAAKSVLPYRISVDVRQRHDQIQLKSLQATPWHGSDGKLHFQSNFAGGWLAGQLDEKSGAMNLIVERRLTVDGMQQATRTVGDYVCMAATGPMLKGRSSTSVM